MRNVRLCTARSLFAFGAVLAVASCSGGGSETASGASAIPAAAAVAAVRSPESALEAPGATFGGVLDAADLAALAVPATSDVAPVGDATEVLDAGMTLTGSYHGLLDEWSNGMEGFGGMSLDLDRSGASISGSGLARSGQRTLSLTVSGVVVGQYPHSVEVALTAESSNDCPVSGYARRYRHIFFGILSSSVCGTFQSPITYYFKLHPLD